MKKKLISSVVLTATLLASSTTVFADTTYTVKRGDTLTKIAKAHNMTYKQLAELNNITNPNRIYVGDVLTIPTTDTTKTEPSKASEVKTPENFKPIDGAKPAIIPTADVITVTPSADTISSASTGIYYQDGTWSEEKFVELFRDGISKHAAVSISTTNADGTPNAATIVPSFVNADSNEYLKISAGSIGNTVQNLKERKFAVITAYQHNPEETDKFLRNNGIRIVVEAVSDQALIDKFNVGNKYPDNTVYMKIVRFLPLG